MDEFEIKILNMLQTEFPLENRPFFKIAKKLNLSETTVIEKVKELKKKGIIRRISGTFDSEKLGYSSLLCALRVSKENLEEVVEVINKFYGVTHNYQRDCYYNIWFTVTAASKEEIEMFLKKLRVSGKIEKMLELPKEKKFKINAVFDVRK
ncbi:siroheme decarboxylase subunit alpha [Clostridium felsineum]|uniref:siroheme decarboxylase subunit alpha n=1 Tax=Clostridium felsineum TaxID=36839 RepID=UPI00098C9F40|nr:winged helix-turn-helix transcriptional regulator [Clostridium felsineum]URZ15143.1 hypothetical protein CLFE_011610 [Clostridium felsineum DSM 794]